MGIGQIAIWIGAAVGGSLAGIAVTIIGYRLVCRLASRDPLALPTIVRLFFVRGFIVAPPADSPVPPEQKADVSPAKPAPIMKVESPASVPQPRRVIMLEEPPSPVPVVAEKPQLAPALPKPVSAVSSVDRLLEERLPGIMAEIEYNYRIARSFSGDTLIHLQTRVWDGCQLDLNTLPRKVLNELEHIYASVKAANRLVWFSAEFQRKSPELVDKYTNLLGGIVDRVDQLDRNTSPGIETREPLILAYQTG